MSKPKETIYIKNLNEKVKPKGRKQINMHVYIYIFNSI